MTDKLEPCPFCGGEAETVSLFRTPPHGRTFVKCSSCGTSGPPGQYGWAVAAWNTRATPANGEQVERVECAIPPAGWRCTRTPGHDGPCAAVPDTDGLEDEISDALTDSIDMDWTGSVGARAVMRLLREKGVVA